MKKRLLLVLFSLIMLLGVISLAGNVHAEESDPELTVVGCNLSFGSSIYIKYAIYSPDLDGIELLVWTDPQTSYEYGTQKLILNQLDKPETVQGKKCAVFKYTDLAAKQMGDTIYARAHVVRDGIDYYSEVKKYSVLQYAYNKLGRTGTAGTDGLRNLLSNMLNYGGAAQQYFNYDPDRLVTYDWYQVKVVGGTLDDMCYSGLYLPGDKVTLIAPATNENGDTFSAWVNPWGGIAADEATAEITVGEQNLTYTAVYGGSLAYYDNGDGSCTIIGVGNWVGRNLDIPSSIDGLTVTAIESYAFAGNSDITSVTIPESVTRIGDNAFENCTGISDIYYGGTVEQWNNIEFGGNWDKGTRNFVVHCADGDVNLIKPQLVDQSRDELTVGDERFGSLGRNPFETYISLSESLVGSDLRIFGWISSLSEIKSFGYSINDGEIITGEFEHYTEPIIYTVAKAPYASRFEIFAPITEDIQTIKAYLITEKTEEVIWVIHVSFFSAEFDYEENGDGTCKITGRGGKTETELVIPSTINGLTVTAIGEGAFKECSDITSVTIPDTVTRIESWAFECCLSLRSVVIPDSVNEIGEGAFRVCSNLESITIPNGVTRISNVTFEECTVLTGVVIPGSVTEIGDGAFRDCSSLSSITIPESVTLIENCAFERCTNLASIVIPDSVNVIGEGVFRECSNLESITISNGMNRISNILFEGCTGLTSVVLPENVTEIGDGAFRDCSNLSSVIIPYSVNRIEWGAFERCTSLSDIYYGGTIEQWNAIDKDYDWDSGTNDYVVHCSDGDVNVTKPQLVCGEREELTVNGEGVGNTDYEVSVALPTSMIGENLRLYGWVGSRSAIQGFGYSINDGAIITGDFAAEPEEDIIQEAEWQGAQYASRYAILVPLTEGSYTVKAYMITEKGEEAFWMIHVAVSDEFAYVDNSDGTCTITGRGGHMESELVIPSTIQELTVTQIGDGAFRDCTDITSVTLPESVTIINGWAFEGCSNLMSIVIPENVNEIGDGAFRACSALEGITIPDGVTRIGGATFEGCTGLTSVVLPENVTEIGDGAFRDCSNLSSVTIPYSVTLIQGWAFERCTGLSDIYYGGTIEQWNAVEKNVEWDKETGDYVVHCADGDVTKPQLVIVARDELKINDEGFINPGYGQNEDSISIPASLIGENLRIWGWVGSLSEIRGFGYTINDGEIITGEFEVDPGEDVVNAACDRGASFASRFAILVPVNDGAYTIKAYMITETTEEVIWVIHVTVVGQFSYEDNGDGTCTITGRGSHTESDLVIPSKIDGLTVTAIGENAFAGCEGLTSVTFSEKVSVIAENAFEGCTSLTD
ncbi:MAG: leucine-rich repeat protein, partial [Clostridia bacterium]|nr:leucine-rich repeat protein [Clostridia bacterium]